VRVPTDLSRYADWTTWLAEQGATDPDVRVVWVGGSAATGGYDEWSDLDVDLLCTPGEADAVHERLVARARTPSRSTASGSCRRAPGRTGGSASSTCNRGRGALAEPTRIIDLHISELSDRHRFVDVRRHGTPIVVHWISASRCPRWSGCYASSTARRSRQPATSGGDPSDGGASRR
jgi:hypothetical protein